MMLLREILNVLDVNISSQNILQISNYFQPQRCNDARSKTKEKENTRKINIL